MVHIKQMLTEKDGECQWWNDGWTVVTCRSSVSVIPTREFDPRCLSGAFPGPVIPVTYKQALQWLPSQAPGLIGSVLRLVCQVSVYCD